MRAKIEMCIKVNRRAWELGELGVQTEPSLVIIEN
jgi:hypothetical protein